MHLKTRFEQLSYTILSIDVHIHDFLYIPLHDLQMYIYNTLKYILDTKLITRKKIILPLIDENELG